MKKSLFVFTALIFVICISCEQKTDITKEKEAVLKVVQEEGDAYAVFDLNRIYAIHIQDETATRLADSTIYKGWDKIKALYNSYVEGNKMETDFKNPRNIKENAVVKVTGSGNGAWVICDNIWKYDYKGEPSSMHNIQITFLEKVNDKWKISFNAFVEGSLAEAPTSSLTTN